MNKGIVAVAVIIIAVVAVIFASVFKDLPTEDPLPDEIEISSLDELMSMDDGNRYILTTDISMDGVDRSLSISYLNGNGHSITGFTRPLFSYGATLSNLTLSGSASGIGIGLLSEKGGYMSLTDVNISGKLTTSGVDPCGGIAPRIYSKIVGCTIDIDISGKAPAGEIAGTCTRLELKDTNILGSVESECHASGIAYMLGEKDAGALLTMENTTLSSNIKSADSASGIAKTTEDKDVKLSGLCFKDCTIQGVKNVGAVFSELNLKIELGSFIYENTEVQGEQFVGGLFGKVNKVMMEGISNDSGLIVIGLKSAFKDACIGGIAGYSNWTTKGCTNYAVVENQGTGRYVGGIIGYVDGSSVWNSTNKGDVFSKGSYAGGIAGGLYADSSLTCIQSCINHGDVIGTTSVGGISGILTKTRYIVYADVDSCVNLGTIKGKTQVQEIIGDDSCARLKNCSPEGEVIIA